ncbi:hypothetical protein [Clostridium sp.]|uniref:hypothetical protein n=1 Tax=Clostridium sp. TaxID=1506 RepID=UPI00260FCB0C|nr:hypothetical protein [uncultured Clostridium sp.]
MSEINLNEEKKSSKQSVENEGFCDTSNVEMANMTNMKSVPSDTTLEDIRRLYGRSSINKGIYRK